MDTRAELDRSPRRHDVDWLRVLAILLLHLYHTGMVFNTWGYHIKNPDPLPSIELPMAFLHAWRMPLLFFISGIGTMLALRSRSLAGFIGERHRRLLLPLAFGMLVIVPPQIYAERLVQGQTFPSIGAFWLTIFEGRSYPAGNTSWHHLWFVAYLFVYAMLALPVLAASRTGKGGRALERLRGLLARGYTLWFLVVPIAVAQIGLSWRWPTTNALVGDWANFTFNGLLFLFGLLVGFDERIWQRILGGRRLSLGLGVLVLAILLANDVMGIQGGYPYFWEQLLRSCLTWLWVLAAAGYARRYLSFRNRFVDYASEGIYPFYILHQTLIIVFAYPMIRWPLGPWPKLVLLAAASFAASWAIYAWLVRPWSWVRPFFGMKNASRSAPARERGAAPLAARTRTRLECSPEP